MPSGLTITGLSGIKLVEPGDDLGEIAVASWFRLDGLPPDLGSMVLPILAGAGLNSTENMRWH